MSDELERLREENRELTAALMLLVDSINAVLLRQGEITRLVPTLEESSQRVREVASDINQRLRHESRACAI